MNEDSLIDAFEDLYEKTYGSNGWSAVAMNPPSPTKKKKRKPKKPFKGFEKVEIGMAGNGYTVRPKDHGHATKLFVFNKLEDMEAWLKAKLAPIKKD